MEEPRKYKIEEEMNKLNLKSYKAASRLIPKYLNIAFNTFHNYRKLPINGKADIPYATVIMLEGIFGLGRGELANYPIEEKSLAQLIAEESQPNEEA
ncbi:hypothetical protein QG516_14950 [Pedobacter gandavensis]|uniref:hypothetical protein n=1 Tax=Pedobacter TaxID=84567 RepID=UPI001C998889|nr:MULTISPECIES: hypothetical protein [Pedobacter]WGQ07859.1 hypothetical protein QG516_14950 [Pedobacter gandavensis]